MKQSNYNFFYELGNSRYLAFNALRSGLAVIHDETVEKIKSHKSKNHPEIHPELLKELKRGGFLVEDDYNEYGVLVIRRHIQQYANNGLGLTVAPTLNCNLACRYCYENPDKTLMNDKVINGVVEFIGNYIQSGIKRLSISWYGGEPLLGLDVIERLSDELISLCKKKRVRYAASIVTNGTLLSRKIVKKLKKLKVRNAQITLDGTKEIHDSRRPFKSGEGSFDKIIGNIKEVAGVMPISLRINLDVTNADPALNFIVNLKKEEWFRMNLDAGMIHVYYGYVKKYTSSCKCSEEEILKPGDFWSRDLELKKYFYKNLKGFDYYPGVLSGCVATSMHSYVVDSRGNLYKCWNHLGIVDKAVGTVSERVTLNPLSIAYLTESFETDEECRDCKFLPICMGGCVDIRVKAKRGEFDAKDCSAWKYYLEEILRCYHMSKM